MTVTLYLWGDEGRNVRADPALALEAGQLQRHAQLEEGLPAEHGTDEGAVLLQNPEKKCSFDPYLYIRTSCHPHSIRPC